MRILHIALFVEPLITVIALALGFSGASSRCELPMSEDGLDGHPSGYSSAQESRRLNAGSHGNRKRTHSTFLPQEGALAQARLGEKTRRQERGQGRLVLRTTASAATF